MSTRRFQTVTIATMALTLAAAGCGGSRSTPSTALSQQPLGTSVAPTPVPPPAPSTSHQSNASWKHDPRCSLEKLLVTEVALMDDGLIPDNARNESSAHVLSVITRAERSGGSCDAVRQRMRTLLSR